MAFELFIDPRVLPEVKKQARWQGYVKRINQQFGEDFYHTIKEMRSDRSRLITKSYKQSK